MESNQKGRKISFNLGKINHPVYGSTSTELIGEIPLLVLSEFEPIIPQIDYELIKIQAIKLLEVSRCLFEESLDDEILEIINNSLLLTALTSPSHIFDSDQNQCLIQLITKLYLGHLAIVGMAEDFIDLGSVAGEPPMPISLDEDSKEMQMLKGVSKAISSSADTDDSTDDNFLTAIPRFKATMPFLKKYIRELKASAKDYKARLQPLKKETEKMLLMIVKLRLEAGKPDGVAGHFSLSVLTCRLYLEIVAFLENAEIPTEIRKNTIFKEFVEQVADLSASISAIFELKDDIRSNKGQNSALLKLIKNGSDFQKTFDLFMERIYQNLGSIQKLAQELFVSYPNDQKVRRYTRFAENYVNGQIFYHSLIQGYKII